MKTRLLLGALAVVALAGTTAFAQEVPGLLPIQGQLTTPSGAPWAAAVDLRVALYDAETAGNLLYSEDFPGVDVLGSRFAVDLGAGGTFSGGLASLWELFNLYDAVWVTLSIDDGTELPRQQVLSGAYAFRASVAGSAEGLACDACIGANQIAGGAVTAAKLAPGSVGSAHLAGAAVDASKIAGGAVTAAKLGEPCATGEILVKTATGWGCGTISVGAGDLADGAVTAEKIGEVCGVGEVLIQGASGWACGTTEGAAGANLLRNPTLADVDANGAADLATVQFAVPADHKLSALDPAELQTLTAGPAAPAAPVLTASVLDLKSTATTAPDYVALTSRVVPERDAHSWVTCSVFVRRPDLGGTNARARLDCFGQSVTVDLAASAPGVQTWRRLMVSVQVPIADASAPVDHVRLYGSGPTLGAAVDTAFVRYALPKVEYGAQATRWNAGFGLITADDLADGSVLGRHIAPDAVGALHIASGAVGTAELAAGAVTNAKIAAGAVNSASIADGAVANADLADAAVTSAKIAAGAVGTTELAAGAVTNAKIAAGAVNSASIADGSIAGGDIAAGQLNRAHVAATALVTVYQNLGVCAQPGGVTLSTTCLTATCDCVDSCIYYACTGGCNRSSPQSCPTTLLGYLWKP